MKEQPNYPRKTDRTIFIILILGLILHEGAGDPPPENVTLEMTKLDHTGDDVLHIGETVTVRLDIAFPVGVTTDVVLEIAPSINGTVMAVGSLQPPEDMDFNSNQLALTKAEEDKRIAPDLDSDKGIFYRNKYIYTIGDITNSAATLAGSTLSIKYEMVFVNSEKLEGDCHWASAGVQYGAGGMYIWVGQVAYTASADDVEVSNEGTYDVTEVTEIPIGSTHYFPIEISIPEPHGLIAVEGVVLNDTSSLSVVKVKAVDAGVNFKYCMDFPVLQSTSYNCPDGTGSKSLRLEMPDITNKGSRDPSYEPNDSIIKLEVGMLMADDESIVGDTFSIGVGASVNREEIWVAQMYITAAAKTGGDVSGVNDVIVSALGETDVPVDHHTEVEIGVVTVKGTKYTYTVTVNSVAQDGQQTCFRVSQVAVLRAGNNVPCTAEFIEVEYTSTVSPVIDTATAEITIDNNGLYDDTEANTLTLHVTLVGVSRDGDSGIGSKHDVKATLSQSGQTDVDSNSVTLILAGTEEYPDPETNYEINLFNACNESCILSGGTVDFEITVITEANRSSSPLTFQFPMTGNLSTDLFTICGYKTTFVGRNLGCVNEKSFDEKTDTESTDGIISTEFKITPMCNLGYWNHPDDNTFKLAIKLRLRDLPETLQAESLSEWVGFGIRYSSNALWVGQYKTTVFLPEQYSNLMLLRGLAVESEHLNSTWLGNFHVQSSLDYITYTNVTTADSEWEPGTHNDTHDVYMLLKPILAVNARLTSQPCVTQCAPDHGFIASDTTDSLDILGDNDGELKKKTVYLRDDDKTTCFDLPKVGESPPIYWLRANTSLFDLESTAFELSITGKGLKCEDHATPLLQVSFPTSSGTDGFHGELEFCTHKESTTESDTITCVVTCNCPDPAQCAEFFIYITKDRTDTTDPWQLCELKGVNVS
ncbi:hypothetical protein ScPMuIL_008422 [Solemya velum]